MKTARLTLLTTPEFKAFLGVEASRDGISVAELVRSRCEQKPDADDALLAAMAAELRKTIREAKSSLKEGLAEANAVLLELRMRREAVTPGKVPEPPVRKSKAGAEAKS